MSSQVDVRRIALCRRPRSCRTSSASRWRTRSLSGSGGSGWITASRRCPTAKWSCLRWPTWGRSRLCLRSTRRHFSHWSSRRLQGRPRACVDGRRAGADRTDHRLAAVAGSHRNGRRVGRPVTGWGARRRDHGGVAFLDLRDASGVAQVVVRDEILAQGEAHDLRNEYCVKVTGQVRQRPEGNANSDLPTGEIEVVASEIEVLSPAAPLPFQIDERVTVGEEARLKHRSLDLRRPGPAAAIRLRSKVNQAARAVLAERDFVEIETPTLTRSTPEGARDFLVPARLRPGSWYALPQSPQLFKQLLMVAGMERYYQIARCYRDEDF